MSTADLLITHLDAMVPLKITDYLQQGGPSDLDYARARNDYPWQLGSFGDSILYHTKEKQATEKSQYAVPGTAHMIALLVDALAIMAFCPGGITVFGLHFEAVVPLLEEVHP